MFIKSLLFVFFLFFIPFVIIGGFYYSYTKSVLDNEIITESAEQTKIIRAVSDTLIKQSDYITANIINSADVQMLMVNDWFNNIYGNRENALGKLITTFPIVYENIDSIYIYSELNDIVVTNTGASSLAGHQDNNWHVWYEQIEENRMVMVPRTRNNIFPQYISIIRPIYVYNVKRGAVIVNINITKLFELFGDGRYDTEQNIFITDLEGLVLAGSNPDYFGMKSEDVSLIEDISLNKGIHSMKTKVGNVEYINSVEYSENYNLVYITSTSTNRYKDKMNYIITVISLLIVSLLIISIFVAYIISIRSFKPIREIISVLEEPEKFDEFFDGIRTGNLNELKYIIKRILQTIQNNSEMKTELEDRLKLLDKSHFAMLQTQINPHFLYNTFEAINWMAIGLSNKSDNPVSSALYKLGELFRMTTKSSNYFISVNEEISQAKLYIDILKLRYEDMFEVYWEIPDEILEKAVIKITLQPFIENSLYHGIKPKGSGTIKIKGSSDGQRIILKITDDGVGMTESRLNNLIEMLETNFKENDLHIGIYNVYRRYKIVFGDDCVIKISSEENGGTSAELSFPAVTL